MYLKNLKFKLILKDASITKEKNPDKSSAWLCVRLSK